MRLLFLDTLLIVADLDQARVSLFTPHGDFLRVYSVRFGVRTLAVSADSLDFMARSRGGLAEIRRSPLSESSGRTLIPATDPFLASATSGNRDSGADVPPYASGGQRMAVADPLSYIITYYRASGAPTGRLSRELPGRRRTARELETAAERITRLMRGGMRGPGGRPVRLTNLERRLDSLPEERLPHFGRHGMAFDDKGRLWVIGEANDSTFADVFADTVFLGRHMLPCTDPNLSVSFNRRWLALICRTDGGDTDAEVQLYRIEDSAPDGLAEAP